MRAGRAAFAAAAVAAALLALFLMAAPTRAQDDDDEPGQLTVTVVSPHGAAVPRPTGRVFVSGDGGELLSLRLVRGIERSTSVARVASGALAALGSPVTISYLGDDSYEASDGVTVTLPTLNLPSIVARPKDATAPEIEILSPSDGARYARGEAVVASYSCHGPDERSEVTECEGPVADGSAVDTDTDGTFSFAVSTEDALGNEASKTVTYEVGGQASAPASSPPSNSGGNYGNWAPAAVAPTAVAAPAIAAARPPSEPARRSPTRRPASDTASRNGGSAGSAPPVAPAAGTPKIAGVQRAPASPARVHRAKASAKNRAAPTTGSTEPAVASAAQQGLAGYDPRSEPAKMIGILVAAFTLLQLCSSRRGLALAAGGAAGGHAGREQHASGPTFDLDYGGVDVEFLGAGLGAIALGDRSRTWGWPGTRTLDALSAALPARLARRSPLLARVAADGTYLRAILGSGSLLGMLAGLALGFAAIQDTGGDALPPLAALTIAIAVLGVLDAAAGLLAVLTFTVGVLVLGGVDSAADVRLMLGLGALWFVVPVLAGAARPLRRPPTRSLKESWDRAADFVIASLIGAWAVQKIVLSLPGLAGMRLPIAEHANTAALCVLAALVARLAAETIASHLYPRRLDISEASDLPDPGALQRLGASALRTAIFLFFAQIVVGTSWQLWVGAALFVAPQLLALYEERFPNSPRLYRALPKGLVELVLMLFVASAVGALLLSTMNENAQTFLANSFVLLSLPGFLLSLLNLFGREGNERQLGWGKRIGGIAVLVAAILLALGLLL
ncbi:MAG: hypothetical protein QOJ63_1850 [Solirubrobacteraceae bacterium]|jgi:hypothetical protein|nr:hypothetical protein [Solirubrobacteraceae bacterium]